MAVAYFYSNTAVAGTIGTAGGLSTGAVSLQMTATPSGYPNQYPFKLRLDPNTASEEVVKVTAGSGTAGSPWTIVRGWDGTTAKTHAQTSGVIAHGMTAEDLSLSRTHENLGNASGVHGLPSSAWSAATIAQINETILNNSTTSVVTWSSIPQIYSHLLVFVLARSTSTGAQFVDIGATINGDTAARYSALTMDLSTTSGSLVGPTASAQSAQTSWPWFLNIAAAQAGSSVNAGGGYAILPNYSGTAMNKMFVSQSGFGNGNSSAATSRSRWGWYNPTSQTGISTLALSCGAGNYLSGSYFALYALT